MKAIPVSILILWIISCGSQSKKETSPDIDNITTPTENSNQNPTEFSSWASVEAIQTELATENYKQWAKEEEIHDSTGPHGGLVLTYVNEVLEDSLDANNQIHPIGSVAVKELYGQGSSITGYAVETKTESGASGDSWYWYEDFLSTGDIDFSGQGIATCTGCHSGGQDYVWTNL